MDKEEIVKGLTNAIALLKKKEEIIRRLKKLAEHAIHTPGEQPFIISFDDGIALNEAVQLLKEQEEKQVKLCGKEEWVGFACVCPDCKARWMGSKSETHFCPNCGRPVKYE